MGKSVDLASSTKRITLNDSDIFCIMLMVFTIINDYINFEVEEHTWWVWGCVTIYLNI